MDYVTDHLQAAGFARAADSSLVWQHLTRIACNLYTPLVRQTGISTWEPYCKGEKNPSYNQANGPLRVQKEKPPSLIQAKRYSQTSPHLRTKMDIPTNISLN